MSSAGFRLGRLFGGVCALHVAYNGYQLYKVENGAVDHIKAGGRLHAFAVTGNADPNSWYRPIHLDIGIIYLGFGEFGANRIGDVFSSNKMQSLLSQPLSNDLASETLAINEYEYWIKVNEKNPLDPGGILGSAFPPSTRHVLQCCTAQTIRHLEQTAALQDPDEPPWL